MPFDGLFDVFVLQIVRLGKFWPINEVPEAVEGIKGQLRDLQKSRELLAMAGGGRG
jgi:hypothetical protein